MENSTIHLIIGVDIALKQESDVYLSEFQCYFESKAYSVMFEISGVERKTVMTAF